MSNQVINCFYNHAIKFCDSQYKFCPIVSDCPLCVCVSHLICDDCVNSLVYIYRALCI